MQIILKNGLTIGDGSPVFIIAEVGSNFITKADCIKSIHQAAIAGASAVKFQLYTHQELYGFPGEVKGVLDPTWLPDLKAEADKRNVLFMCTAFSPEGYEVINPWVMIHKIASSEACHLRILQKVRQLGKPVILSTGAKGYEDIKGAIKVLEDTPTVLMYCVVAYPARRIDVAVCRALKNVFNTLVGYSDHSTDILILPRAATFAGACVIEKHFTIIPEVSTPDQPHSLDPSEFKLMVDNLRNTLPIKIGPIPEEKTALLKYNRRIMAIKDLNPGDELIEGVNIGIFRSLKDDTRAAHPFTIDNFIGKRMKVSLKCGEGIWIDDIERSEQ